MPPLHCWSSTSANLLSIITCCGKPFLQCSICSTTYSYSHLDHRSSMLHHLPDEIFETGWAWIVEDGPNPALLYPDDMVLLVRGIDVDHRFGIGGLVCVPHGSMMWSPNLDQV